MPKTSKLKVAAKGINKNAPSLGELRDLEKEVTGYFDSSSASVNILMFVDNTANDSLVAEVRNLFLTKVSYVKFQLAYFDKVPNNIDGTADMAIVLAGDSACANELAQKCRDNGVPAYIICEAKAAFVPAATFAGDFIRTSVNSTDSVNVMQEALAKWIAAICTAKKFEFARAFPFVANPIALESVHLTAIENAAIGFVPFLKGADFPIMFVNQLKMLGQIAAVYGVDFDMKMLKEAAGVLVFAIFGKRCYKVINKIIPLPSFVVAAPVSFLTTEAAGRLLIEYFQAGGDLQGVAKVIEKGIDKSGAVGRALKPAVDAISPVAAKITQGFAK